MTQVTEIVGGGAKFRLDFAWIDQRVAVEIDGFQFHDGPDRFVSDRYRPNLLTDAGWHVRYAARFADFYSVAIRWPSVTARMTTWAGLPGHSTGNPAQGVRTGRHHLAGQAGAAPAAGG